VIGPRDEDILAIIAERPQGTLTYVIRNGLRQDGKGEFPTSWILRRLQRLQRQGKVERVPTPYAAHASWRPKADG
jgi:hypothetical protein